MSASPPRKVAPKAPPRTSSTPKQSPSGLRPKTKVAPSTPSPPRKVISPSSSKAVGKAPASKAPASIPHKAAKSPPRAVLKKEPPAAVPTRGKGPPRLSPQVLRTASSSSASVPRRKVTTPRTRPHPQGSLGGSGSDSDTSSLLYVPLPDNGSKATKSRPPSITSRPRVGSEVASDSPDHQRRSASSSICFVLESHTNLLGGSAPNSRRPTPVASPTLRSRGVGDASVVEPSPIKILNLSEAPSQVDEPVRNAQAQSPPPLDASSSSSSVGEVVFTKRRRNVEDRRSVSSTTDDDRGSLMGRRQRRANLAAKGVAKTLSDTAGAADSTAKPSDIPVVLEDPFGDGELYRDHGISYAPPVADEAPEKQTNADAPDKGDAETESDGSSVGWAKRFEAKPIPPSKSPEAELAKLQELLVRANSGLDLGDTRGNKSASAKLASSSASAKFASSAGSSSSIGFAPIPVPPALPEPQPKPHCSMVVTAQSPKSSVSVGCQAFPLRARIEAEDLVTTSPTMERASSNHVLVREVGTVTIEKGLVRHLGPPSRRPDPEGYAYLQTKRSRAATPTLSHGGGRPIFRYATPRKEWDNSQPEEVVPWEKQLRNAGREEKEERRKRRLRYNLVDHLCCVGEFHQHLGELGMVLRGKLEELPSIVEAHAAPAKFPPNPLSHQPAATHASSSNTRTSPDRHSVLRFNGGKEEPPNLIKPIARIPSPNAPGKDKYSSFLEEWRASRRAAADVVQTTYKVLGDAASPETLHEKHPATPSVSVERFDVLTPDPTPPVLIRSRDTPAPSEHLSDKLCVVEHPTTRASQPVTLDPYSYATDPTIDADLEAFVLRQPPSNPPPYHLNQTPPTTPSGVCDRSNASTTSAVGSPPLIPQPQPSTNVVDKEVLLLTLLQQSMALQAEELKLKQARLERHNAREERRRLANEKRKASQGLPARGCNLKEFEALKACAAKIKDLEVENITLRHLAAAKEDEVAILRGEYVVQPPAASTPSN